jgi:hypothetical protein
MNAHGSRGAGYLGRVLGPGGAPIGTCFQVTPGVVVTASHVLEEAGAGARGAQVWLDSLFPDAGADPIKIRGETICVDRERDLAVVRADGQLTASVVGLATTDIMEISADVLITGVSQVTDRHTYRYLDAPGKWVGHTIRGDDVELGRVRSSDLMPGMSGAPVCRQLDGLVVGVVSSRYNSADGWLRDSVWVARVEDLLPLLEGLSDIVVRHAEQGPLATAPRPAQLPPDIGQFTGRDVELARLRQLILANADAKEQAAVISTIVGAAGVGKTALAVHLAHELTTHFPDAQLYANLHGYDPQQLLSSGQVLDRFLRALGVPDDALPVDLDEQAALYRSVMARKRALVVLDNASAADQIRPLLPASPRCVTLATSRHRLAGLIAADGVSLLVLDVLPREEAVELLNRVVGTERVSADPYTAGELVEICGRLPLALRIVAATLVSQPSMTLKTLADRLSDERHRLSRLAVDDVSVRAAFGSSYQALNPEEARMFRRLSLVSGPSFSIGVAAALTNTTVETAETLVEAFLRRI